MGYGKVPAQGFESNWKDPEKDQETTIQYQESTSKLPGKYK